MDPNDTDRQYTAEEVAALGQKAAAKGVKATK